MNLSKSRGASVRVLGPVARATPADLDRVALPLLPAIADIDDARRALVRLHGRAVPVANGETGVGPVIDGLSIRFLPVPGRRLVGIDFDGVIDEQRRLHRACRWLLDELETFVEVSVSGRGLHAYVWADVDDDAPDCTRGHGLGEGYGRFVPWPSKVPSVAIYCGRTWRHFRWSGIGYGRWGGLPIADGTATVNRWMRDIVACRAVDAWRRSLERPVEAPGRPRSMRRGPLVDLRNLSGHEVAGYLDAKRVGGSWVAFCPHCKARGRVSRSGRPSLSIWTDGGRVAVTCHACQADGLGRDAYRAVLEVVTMRGRR